jgi:hypothetical protein
MPYGGVLSGPVRVLDRLPQASCPNGPPPAPAPGPLEPKPAPGPLEPKPAPGPLEPKPAPAPAPGPLEPKPAPGPPVPKPAPGPPEPRPPLGPPDAKRRLPARTRMCHDVSPNSSYYDCLDSNFCAHGALGETPPTASLDFVVSCSQGAYGSTERIQLCRDFVVGKELVPQRALFLSLIDDELKRVCGPCAQ